MEDHHELKNMNEYTQLLHIYQIIFFRSAVTFCFITILLFRLRIPILGNNKILLFLRGFFGGISMILLFYAYTLIPLSQAMAISFSTPLFIYFGSMPFLTDNIVLK